MTPTPTPAVEDLDRLESAARGELGAKSLGEKLHDAARPVWAGQDWHNDSSADVQAEYERVALAFAASLSHDETANAVIADLEGRLQQAEGERDRLRMPKRDEMIERSDEEWQDFEEGTMLLYSLKPGHVLTEADIKSLTFADDCRRNDDESATDAYHRGREEGLRERGGNELFDLTMRHEKAVSERSVERAMKVFAEARATTAEAKCAGLVEASAYLVGQFDLYREGDCSQASAHNLLVRYDAWEKLKDAILSAKGV